MEDIAFGDAEDVKKSSGISSDEDVEKIQLAARTALQEKLRNINVDEESEEEKSEEDSLEENKEK